MSQGCISRQTVFDVALQEVITPIVPQVEAIVHFLQGALPEALQVEPAAQGTWHTVFDVAVQVSLTPARSHLESTAHFSHGSLPDFEKDLLPMQGAASPLHTISEPGVQGALMPFAPQVEAAAHFVHGALPDELHVVRAAHATWQTVLVVAVQAALVPAASQAMQCKHGSLPVSLLKLEPTAHATSHTVSVVAVQAVFTPAAPHVLHTVPE